LTVHNIQPPEPRNYREDGTLDVHSIWYTIQGEGPFAGQPAIFIRLTGCNLRCPLCDTEYTSTRHALSAEEIAREISVESAMHVGMYRMGLIVITGGEPFRQNIDPLVRLLVGRGYTVQIETNGTQYPGDDFPFDLAEITCCPKTTMSHSQLIPYVDSWKYVLQADHISSVDGLPTSILGMNRAPQRPPEDFPRHLIFLNPVDESHPTKNKRNTIAAAQSCLKHGYRFGVQLHKLAGLP
jgi:7-carboxy-7-deazaguanine synthase